MAERTLDEIAADIREALGVTDDDRRTSPWRITCNSAEDCSCCGKCGTAIAPGETVMRARRSIGPGVWRLAIAPRGVLPSMRRTGLALEISQACAEVMRGLRTPRLSEVRLIWVDRLDGYEAAPVTCCEQCA